MNAPAEISEKAGDFLAGRWGRLTSEEIAEFKEAQDDPSGAEWERAHTGELMGVTELEANGVLVVYFPEGETLEQSRARLLAMVGAHPVTPARLWCVARRMMGALPGKKEA